MPQINLLPWREERRQRRQKNFLQLVSLVVLFAVLITLAIGQLVQYQVDTQTHRNSIIQQGIKTLDKDIKEIRALRKKREQLLNWIQIIQNLQADRNSVVLIMNSLAHAGIDELYLTEAIKQGNTLQLTGEAGSNRQISDLMRHLAGIEIFDTPALTDVSTSENTSGFSRFVLQVTQNPKQAGGSSDEK
jgi:type IV pilus assembly protein PilN